MELQETKKTIEAALFIAPTHMPVDELARISGVSIAEARMALNELSSNYLERDSALEIKEEPAGYRMGLKPDLEQKVRHLAASSEFNKSVMKTLALIAYKQPIKQADVIKYRNTKAYDHIHMLNEKGFIRREKKGITFVLYTTKKFTEYFGEQKQQKKKDVEANAPQNLAINQ
ncbi:MAG: SMC-Scp complex subunit ScpB [Candidatus Diapherotrites archaeon]